MSARFTMCNIFLICASHSSESSSLSRVYVVGASETRVFSGLIFTPLAMLYSLDDVLLPLNPSVLKPGDVQLEPGVETDGPLRSASSSGNIAQE